MPNRIYLAIPATLVLSLSCSMLPASMSSSFSSNDKSSGESTGASSNSSSGELAGKSTLKTTGSSSDMSKEMSDQLKRFEEYGVASVTKNCGGLEVTVDTKSFVKAVERKQSGDDKAYSLSDFCGAPLTDLGNTCNIDERTKGLVNQQVKAYTCKYDQNLEKPQLTIEDGVMTMASNFDVEGSHYSWSRIAIGDAVMDGTWSLRQTTLIKDQERRIDSELGNYKHYCKTVPKWSVDWESVRGDIEVALLDNATAGFYGQCTRPLTELTKICQDGGSKYVSEQVQSYHCSFSKKGSQPSLRLTKGSLSLKAAWKHEDVWKYIVKEVNASIRVGAFSWPDTLYIKHEDMQVRNSLAGMKTHCGFDIKASIDWESFKPILDPLVEKTNYEVAEICDDVIQRLGSVCANGRQKEVQNSVQSLRCQYNPRNKVALSLTGKNIVVATSLKAESSYDPVDTFLIKKKIMKERPKMRKMTKEEVRNALRIDPKTQCRQRCQSNCRTVGNISKCRKNCANRCR